MLKHDFTPTMTTFAHIFKVIKIALSIVELHKKESLKHLISACIVLKNRLFSGFVYRWGDLNVTLLETDPGPVQYISLPPRDLECGDRGLLPEESNYKWL